MTNPTPTQAANLQTGIAVAQTAYALNNGGGLQIGQPLMKVEDTSMVGLAGARPLEKMEKMGQARFKTQIFKKGARLKLKARLRTPNELASSPPMPRPELSRADYGVAVI